MTAQSRLQIARLAGIGLACVLLQAVVVSQLSLFGATADLRPLVVASVGLLCGAVTGALFGFSVGLFVDMALLQTLGLSSLVLSLVGHFSGRLRETARDPGATLLPLLAGGVATLTAAVTFGVLQFLLGVESPVSGELVREIVTTVLANCLLALPLHALVRRAAAAEDPRRVPRRRVGLSPLQQS